MNITDYAFLPNSLTIRVGETVTWVVRGSLNHTVTSVGGLWYAGNLTNGNGSAFQVTFTNAGTYEYLCAYHTTDSINSQRGSITVLPADNPVPRPSLLLARQIDGTYLLILNGAPGMTYRVEYTENLGRSTWNAVGNATADATGQVELPDRAAGGPLQRFYRSVYP